MIATEKLHANAIDETGNRYGRLIVIESAGRGKRSVVLWKCRCDCGGETSVVGTSLRRGRTKSCGCLNVEMCRGLRGLRELPHGEAAFNHLFRNIKCGAEKRGYRFDLTRVQVQNLVVQNCEYCGAAPSQKAGNSGRYGGEFLYNGIDRTDNTLGYVGGNCAPCCKTCNFAKRKMTTDEFKSWLTRAYKHFVEGNIQ